MYTGLQEGCIKIFDLETCQCIRTLGTAKSQVLSLTMYHGLLAAGLANSQLMLWDSKFVPKKPIRHHSGPIQRLGSNDQYLVSASDDKSLKVPT